MPVSQIWDNEDVHDLRSVKTEFPAIVFNDTLTFEAALSCEPTVSSLNNDKIDFRISFDESDDEDYTTVYTAYPNPMDTVYWPSGRYPIFIFQHSRYGVFVKRIQRIRLLQASIRRILGYGYGVSTSCIVLGPSEGKLTNVGGEFTNLEILKCWSLETSRRLFNTHSCSIKINMENLPSNYQGIFSF
ncbi:hypothetical protein Tco_0770053 [Tanacetum coccineum]|uniref:Uncharacterized protein n=1 Tax=Tanacetum coccineum TaxID=301880 RepID=A0ABQ4ZEM7_9ASTR